MKTIEQLLQVEKYSKKVILEKLICHYCALSKKDLFIKLDYQISDEQMELISNGYEAYTVEKKPLEYIVGYVEFTGLKFTVSPKTLIPRPETEYMIQAVSEDLEGKKNVHLLDIGTGCGVLGLASYYHNQSAIDSVLLTELDPDTLDVAKNNAKNLFEENALDSVEFLEASLLAHKQIKEYLNHEQVFLVANLPYIPEPLFEDNTDEGVKKREPKMAFVGGNDGCDLYRIMFDQLLERKGEREKEKKSTKGLIMFLEMMTRQVDVLRKEYPQFQFEEVKTFHFNIRIVKGWLK